MSWVRIDPASLSLENHRRELVLVEEVLRQRVDFWEEIRRQFKLSDRLPRDRYLHRAPSGGLYDVVFIGRTDEPFPSGMEFWYLAEGFEPLPPKATIDADLWDFARNLVSIVETQSPERTSLEVFDQLLPKP